MKALLAILITASVVPNVAYATLAGRDLDGNLATFEAFYDTDLNITWLADANYAKTSSYYAVIINGGMTQENANAWATNLSFTDTVNNVTYDNWRLPSARNQDGTVCFGYNCTNSEMGHMFYSELGGIAGQNIAATHNANYDLFINIEPYYYWSFDLGVVCRNFNFKEGYPCDGSSFSNGYYAWAVSDGDIGVAAVPEPSAWILVLTGLSILGVATRQGRYGTSDWKNLARS